MCIEARRQLGLTMLELITVIMLAAILAAVALPRFDTIFALRNDDYRDSVLTGLRLAGKTAVAQRRLVCATLDNTSLTLTVAATNPATSCNRALVGPDGSTVFARNANTQGSTSVSPSGTIYFQPDGRATSDGAGSTVSSRTITVAGSAYAISLIGGTGHVE